MVGKYVQHIIPPLHGCEWLIKQVSNSHVSTPVVILNFFPQTKTLPCTKTKVLLLCSQYQVPPLRGGGVGVKWGVADSCKHWKSNSKSHLIYLEHFSVHLLWCRRNFWQRLAAHCGIQHYLAFLALLAHPPHLLFLSSHPVCLEPGLALAGVCAVSCTTATPRAWC